MAPIRRLAFVVNTEKPGAAALARELIAIARTVGVRRIKSRPNRKLPAGYFKGCDVGCIIGGDGTLLGAVSEAAHAGVPLIGVNQGSLGYLTSFSPEEARACSATSCSATTASPAARCWSAAPARTATRWR